MTNDNAPTERCIPNTRLTEQLRALWSCTEGGESWENWYDRHCCGGSPNGRAVAAILFDRAQRYWPDFFSPADTPAVVAWGDIFDHRHPLITPDVIEQAVDDVWLMAIPHPVPGHFTQAAERIIRRTSKEAGRGA